MLYSEQFQRIFEALADAPPIETCFLPSRAFILVSLLQLALRHPSIAEQTPEIYGTGRDMANNMIKKLGEIDPVIAQTLDQGWTTEFDMTQSEFNQMEMGQPVEPSPAAFSSMLTQILEIHTLVLFEAIELLAKSTGETEENALLSCIPKAVDAKVKDPVLAVQRFNSISELLGEHWNSCLSQLPE